jgi:hypothetical protein
MTRIESTAAANESGAEGNLLHLYVCYQIVYFAVLNGRCYNLRCPPSKPSITITTCINAGY